MTIGAASLAAILSLSLIKVFILGTENHALKRPLVSLLPPDHRVRPSPARQANHPHQSRIWTGCLTLGSRSKRSLIVHAYVVFACMIRVAPAVLCSFFNDGFAFGLAAKQTR